MMSPKARRRPLLLMLAAVLLALSASAPAMAAAADRTGLVEAAAYTGRLHGLVVEHREALYQQTLGARPDLTRRLDGLAADLRAGATWLEQQGEREAARSLRGYLTAAGRVVVPAGGFSDPTGLAAAGAHLGGPVHEAALGALLGLEAVQHRLQAAAALSGQVRVTPAPAAGRIAFLLGALGLLLFLLGLLAGRASRSGRSTDEAELERRDLADQVPLPAPAPALVPLLSARVQNACSELTRGLRALTGGVKEEGEALQSVTGMSAEIRRLAAELAAAAGRAEASVKTTLAQQGSQTLRATATLLERQAHALQECAGRVEETAGAAAGLTASAAQHLDQALAGMQRLSARGAATGQSLQTLTERAEPIERMAEAIKAIATRTNMVALNAAIEAARAGEHGRGFAVVADSVRQLAGQVDQHAREIERRVAGMAEEAARGVQAVAAQEEAAAELADLLAKIRTQVTHVTAALSGQAPVGQSLREVGTALEQAGQQNHSPLPALGLSPLVKLAEQLQERLLDLEQQATVAAQEAAERAIALAEASLIAQEAERTAAGSGSPTLQ